MLSRSDFVSQSLELHLFFTRIMKEHSFFLETSFTPRDHEFQEQADEFRLEFDKLLAEVVSLSCGVVNPLVLASGEVVTPYTLKAEMASSYYTGVTLATEITQSEEELSGGNSPIELMLERRVFAVNERAMHLISGLIQFKQTILSNVLTCKMFTLNYPLLIDHIMREAKLYLQLIRRLQKRDIVNLEREALEQEVFWNTIMAEHAMFIRGLLDPTENELIETANNFGNDFIELRDEALAAMDYTLPLKKVTEDSLKATKEIRDFKEQGTKGLLDCQIRSIIIPLLADHTLREANHFLRLLKIFNR